MKTREKKWLKITKKSKKIVEKTWDRNLKIEKEQLFLRKRNSQLEQVFVEKLLMLSRRKKLSGKSENFEDGHVNGYWKLEYFGHQKDFVDGFYAT